MWSVRCEMSEQTIKQSHFETRRALLTTVYIMWLFAMIKKQNNNNNPDSFLQSTVGHIVCVSVCSIY